MNISRQGVKKRTSKLPQFKTNSSNIPQFGKKKEKSPLKKGKSREKQTSYVKILMKKDVEMKKKMVKVDQSPEKKSNGLVMELPLRASKKRIYPTRNKKLNNDQQSITSEFNHREETIDDKLMKGYKSGKAKKKDDLGIKGLLGPYLDSFKNNISYPVKPETTENESYRRSKTDLGGIDYNIDTEDDITNYTSRYKSSSIQDNGNAKLNKTPKKVYSKPKYSSSCFALLNLIIKKIRNKNKTRAFSSVMIKAFDIKMKVRSATKMYQIKNKYKILNTLKTRVLKKKQISACYTYRQEKVVKKSMSKKIDTFFDDAIPNQMDLPTPQQLDIAPPKPVLLPTRSKSPHIPKPKKKTPKKKAKPVKKKPEPVIESEEEDNEIALLMEKMFKSQEANK